MSDQFIERHPDKRPSDAGLIIEERPTGDVIALMPVRGLGVLVLRGFNLEHGLSIFTDDEILFDPA